MYTQDQLKADITLDVHSSSFLCSLYRNILTYGQFATVHICIPTYSYVYCDIHIHIHMHTHKYYDTKGP